MCYDCSASENITLNLSKEDTEKRIRHHLKRKFCRDSVQLGASSPRILPYLHRALNVGLDELASKMF